MNKKQYEEFHSIKEVNRYLIRNGSTARLYADKTVYGDYHLKWKTISGNLPDHIKELKYAKELHTLFLKTKREEAKLRFLKD